MNYYNEKFYLLFNNKTNVTELGKRNNTVFLGFAVVLGKTRKQKIYNLSIFLLLKRKQHFLEGLFLRIIWFHCQWLVLINNNNKTWPVEYTFCKKILQKTYFKHISLNLFFFGNAFWSQFSTCLFAFKLYFNKKKNRKNIYGDK